MTAADPPGLDLDRLRGYLDHIRPGLVTGRLRGQLIAGGRSNLTYDVSDGTQRWVVRRPPLGHVLATAHDMGREHRVITALRDTVPVPRTVLLCEDPAVIGAPFFVMEFVDGTPYRTRRQLAELGPARTRTIALGLVETLGRLHEVEPAAVGLADFGRAEGFLERQLRRWKRQLDASHSRDVPGIDHLHDRLRCAVPASGSASIVHGDYRLDNVLVGDDDEIAALLDWEMSTVGDPLTDLALLMVYRDVQVTDGGPLSTATAAAGFPSSQTLVEAYRRRTGRDLTRLHWYVALGCFKLAVILEGIHYRFRQGMTVGEDFDRVGDLVAPLVEQGITRLDSDPGPTEGA